MDHDEWILEDDSKILADLGIGQSFLCAFDGSALMQLITENETEISFFNRETYEAFKKHPEVSPISTFSNMQKTDGVADEMVINCAFS